MFERLRHRRYNRFVRLADRYMLDKLEIIAIQQKETEAARRLQEQDLAETASFIDLIERHRREQR